MRLSGLYWRLVHLSPDLQCNYCNGICYFECDCGNFEEAFWILKSCKFKHGGIHLLQLLSFSFRRQINLSDCTNQRRGNSRWSRRLLPQCSSKKHDQYHHQDEKVMCRMKVKTR